MQSRTPRQSCVCFLDALNSPRHSPAFQSLCVPTTKNPSYSSAPKIGKRNNYSSAQSSTQVGTFAASSLSLSHFFQCRRRRHQPLTLSRNCVCQFFSILCSRVLLVSKQATNQDRFCDKPPTFLHLWSRVGRPPVQVKLH